MQRFTCDCGNVLFFENSKCLKCGRDVGYDHEGQRMLAITPGGWMRQCRNGIEYGICNWIVSSLKGEVMCPACKLNRTIPDLRNKRNMQLWAITEAAKRRLLYSMTRLGFVFPSLSENPRDGLAFDIVSTISNPDVTMGHLNGVITVNLEEADDTYRQINQQQLGESSRTLLGHFRHESAHYIWQRFVGPLMWDDPIRDALRARFGDERQDYSVALNSHYKNGAPKDWDKGYISAYATSHPWEDWAETWAHYFQVLDGLETCECLGLEVGRIALPVSHFPAEAGALPPMLPQSAEDDKEFLSWLQRWVCLSTVLNETAASIGQPPLYPFVLSVKVAQKLRLVRYLVKVWSEGTILAHSFKPRETGEPANLSS
jgi:hypothetical protein